MTRDTWFKFWLIVFSPVILAYLFWRYVLKPKFKKLLTFEDRFWGNR